ncbi:MAG TPA: MarR family transcriptional regulator [Caulobacteraceae bacterium]|nr:MarR family transcriptional regulator [Caulobacteraceae bacterium]
MSLDPDRIKGLSGFRYALRRFLSASETISRDAGVTQQQYQVMLAIKASDDGALAMKDLADQLLLKPHAAVQLTDRLARAGLAVRTQSTTDRRVVFVSLTPKGDALVDRLAQRHLDEMLRQEPQLRRSLNLLKRLAD